MPRLLVKILWILFVDIVKLITLLQLILVENQGLQLR